MNLFPRLGASIARKASTFAGALRSILFGGPKAESRNLTDEQRVALSEMLSVIDAAALVCSDPRSASDLCLALRGQRFLSVQGRCALRCLLWLADPRPSDGPLELPSRIDPPAADPYLADMARGCFAVCSALARLPLERTPSPLPIPEPTLSGALAEALNQLLDSGAVHWPPARVAAESEEAALLSELDSAPVASSRSGSL